MPWQAIRQQTRAGNCRAGVLSEVIAVKPERGTDESAVPLSRPRLGSSLSSASSRSKTALMLSPDLQGRLALLVRTQAARCCATGDRAPAALAPPPVRLEVRRVVQNEPNCSYQHPVQVPRRHPTRRP